MNFNCIRLLKQIIIHAFCLILSSDWNHSIKSIKYKYKNQVGHNPSCQVSTMPSLAPSHPGEDYDQKEKVKVVD